MTIVTIIAVILAVGMMLTMTLRRQLAIREDLRTHGASWVDFASADSELLPNVLYEHTIEDTFKQHKRLGTVELKCYDVTPECIDRLSAVEHIDSLYFISCGLCDDDLVDLPTINVTNLLFWNANITDSATDTLAKMRGLKRITFKTTKVTPQGIDKLQTALPSVEIVSAR